MCQELLVQIRIRKAKWKLEKKRIRENASEYKENRYNGYTFIKREKERKEPRAEK